MPLPIIAELERNFPIVGYIEDPLDKKGHRRLEAPAPANQSAANHARHALGAGSQELIYGLADMYMIGGTLEDTMAAGWACGRANVQVLLQFEGGTLGKAMAMHIASVLPTHTAHSINLDDQYAEDYTTETIPVVDGASPVPNGPGLGFTVDEDALARLAAPIARRASNPRRRLADARREHILRPVLHLPHQHYRPPRGR